MPRLSALLIGLTSTFGLAGCRDAPVPTPVPPAATGGGAQTTMTVTEEVTEPTETAGGFESPEAAFAAMTEAIRNEDFAVAASCMTPESQEVMATGLMVVAGLVAAFGGEASPVAEVFEKYEIDIGTEESAMPEDLPAFLADLFKAMESMDAAPDEGPAQWANAELTDLTIDGDTATANVVIQTDEGEQSESAEFRNSDSGWLVHLGSLEDLIAGSDGPMIDFGTGGERPSEPLAEAVLEDGLTSTIDVTFEQPFEPVFFSSEFADGTLFVTLNLVGNVILSTYEYGEFQVVAAEDSTGGTLELAAPVQDNFSNAFGEEFVELQTFFLDEKDTLPILFALTPPADGAEQLATLEFSVKLKVRESIVVEDVIAGLGGTIEVEDVGEFTINSQDADNGDPDHGLKIEFSSSENTVESITLLDGDGKPLNTDSTLNVFQTFVIDTGAELPEDTQMRISLGGSESIKIVPLKFEGLALER